MIRVDTRNSEKHVSASELDEVVKQNLDLLKRCQKGEEKYAASLGWHDTDTWADEAQVKEFLDVAKEVRDHADVLVVIGIGGSNNAARAVVRALEGDGKIDVLFSGNNISAHELNKAMAACDGKSVYILDIAKNFETLEPGISFRAWRHYLKERYGDDYSRRVIALGTIGSSLDRLCKDNGFRFLPFATTIGGRFTAVSSVGLLPMAAAGIDIEALVKGAKDMERELKTTLEDNAALRYACLRNLLYDKGYRVEMLSSFETRLSWFNNWWIQLFAESEGKDGKGIYPVASEYSEQLHSVGQYVQDGSRIMFETFLDVSEEEGSYRLPEDDLKDGFDYVEGKDFREINRAAYEATLQAHASIIPCITLSIDRLDAYHFGQLFYFFEFACYVSGSILGVDPFDQPGVEAYKTIMFQKLGK